MAKFVTDRITLAEGAKVLVSVNNGREVEFLAKIDILNRQIILLPQGAVGSNIVLKKAD